MKKFITIAFLLMTEYTWACPYCSGSSGNAYDKYLVYILGGFILLTYIPFYVLFSLTKRKKKLMPND